MLGSVLLDRVGAALVGKLTKTGVPGSIAPKLLAAKPLIVEGAAPHVSHIPAQLQLDIISGSHAAFLSGLHVAMVVGIVVCIVEAVTRFAIGNKRPSDEKAAEDSLAD